MEPIDETTSLFNEKIFFGSHDGADIEEGQSRDMEYHPPFHNVILNLVFNFVKRILKACCLVCKKLNVLTIPFMRTKYRVHIYGDKSIPTNNHNDIENSRRIQDFVSTFQSNTSGILFSKFELASFCTTNAVGKEFLQLLGYTTKKIILGDRESTHLTIEDVSDILKFMPNLESLSILNCPRSSSSNNTVKLFSDSRPRLIQLKKLTLCDNYQNYNEERLKVCPTFIEELLSVAPNISELIVQNSPDEHKYPIGIDVLNAIEKLGMESSVERLSILFMKSVHVDSLRRMALKTPNGLKLKKLTVLICERKAIIDIHTVVATFFKDTLETFELMNSFYTTNIIDFPKMRRLTKLSLKIPTGHFSKLVNLNLNQIFPALLELKLCGHTPFNDDDIEDEVYKFFPESEPCPNIKSFHLEHTGIRFNLRTLGCILTIFPSLTELILCAGDIKENGVEILRKIWTEMAQLECLLISAHIGNTESVDSILTGIPTHLIRNVFQEVRTLTEMTKELRRETIERLRNEYCQFPDIANLKNLRRLTICVVGDGDEVSQKCLTDVSAYMGLYSMKLLNRLTILESEMTPSCCEVLTMDLELEYSRFLDPCCEEQYHYQEQGFIEGS